MNAWTKQEDDLLLHFYYQAESFKKWKQISDKFLALGIQKSVYECRQRYINKLDPSIKNQKWTAEEIQSLFLFYCLNGSKWQKMQSVIPHRTQGQLKNKFYSFLRSFILKALQQSKQLKIFKVNSISSKTIKRLFEGTQEFAQYSGKMTEYLEVIEYEISSQRIQQLLNKRESQIKQILKILFQNSKRAKSKQRCQTINCVIFKKDLLNSYQKWGQKQSFKSEDENFSRKNGQKNQKLQLMCDEISQLSHYQKNKPDTLEKSITQNAVKRAPCSQFWGPTTNLSPMMHQNGHPLSIDYNGCVQWTKLEFQYPFYPMQNSAGPYKGQQNKTIVSWQENMYFYCMPFNGTQGFYYLM